MKKLVLELKNCACYGYMSYLEMGSDIEVIKFLEDFSMWQGCTKRFKNYCMYELPVETVNFMISDRFRGWLLKHGINLITSDDKNYKEIIVGEVFIQEDCQYSYFR